MMFACTKFTCLTPLKSPTCFGDHLYHGISHDGVTACIDCDFFDCDYCHFFDPVKKCCLEGVYKEGGDN